jgi:uncharacterized protein (TIGR03435 family)
MRFCALPLLAIHLAALPLAAQAPAFEVASIRPSKSTRTAASLCRGLKLGTENVEVVGISLNLMVIDAYETGPDDRFDLPEWGRNLFDVRAKMPPNSDVAGCREMLRNLLAERFHMVTALKTVDVPTYFLKVAKGGLKLKTVDGPPADLRASSSVKTENGRSHWTFRGAPMSRVMLPVRADIAIAARAGVFETDRVIDETGLTGYYDGELDFQGSSQSSTDGQLREAPALKDALIEQAGLTLELRKAPGKILVVVSSDRIPTEN